ncbi:NAD(P)H-binding protein [Sanguibacter sp. 25GB23B1]|uniref:NAD(P)H-binding protein n=1 Tax=unclassified Sanguibacter TaxID=2645534 RepID=UPI0032AF7E98
MLVVGGTGKTGRRVVERLRAGGVEVRVGSRSGVPAFDWEDRGTWGPALDGMTAVYVTYYPDLAFPGVADRVADFAAVAVSAGVEKLVLLSGRGEEGALASERAIEQSGARWTVVRCSWFNQNFDEGFFVDAVRAGVIAIPAGDAVEPFVDADDIADVVVASLLEDGHDGEVYELTGPRLLSFQDVAEELTTAVGRPVVYRPVSAESYGVTLDEAGLPRDFLDLFTLVLDGRNASLTDGVSRALGRKPRDFADYATAAAATGVWG